MTQKSRNILSPPKKPDFPAQLEFDFMDYFPDSDCDFLGFNEFSGFDEQDQKKIIAALIAGRKAFISSNLPVAFHVPINRMPNDNLAKKYLITEFAAEHQLRPCNMSFTVKDGLRVKSCIKIQKRKERAMSTKLKGPAETLLEKKESEKYFLAVSMLIPKIAKELSEKWDGEHEVEIDLDEEPAELVKKFLNEKLEKEYWISEWGEKKLIVTSAEIYLRSVPDHVLQ